MAKFSVVMPIHNEQEYLPYSLPSIYKLEPNEVILLFDRCTDESMLIAKKITDKFRYTEKAKFISCDHPSNWKSRVAWIRTLGYNLANNDIILRVDADAVLDPQIKNHLTLIGKNNIGMICFEYVNYPLSWRDTVEKLIKRLRKKTSILRRMSGFYAFHKKHWKETEDIEDLKTRVTISEDIHLFVDMLKKYKVINVKTSSYHLRPKRTMFDYYVRGAREWLVWKKPLWRTCISAIIYLQPIRVIGYLHARQGKFHGKVF